MLLPIAIPKQNDVFAGMLVLDKNDLWNYYCYGIIFIIMDHKEDIDKNEMTVSANQKKAVNISFLKLKNKKSILLISAVIVVVVTSFLLITNNKPSKTNSTVAIENKVCTQEKNTPLLMQAAGYIYQQNYSALSQPVSKIEQLKNYQYDPNCLYAVLTYNIYTGNISGAYNYLNDLKKVYPKQGLSKMYVDPDNLANLTLEVQSMQAEMNNKTKTVNAINSAYGTISEPKQ